MRQQVHFHIRQRPPTPLHVLAITNLLVSDPQHVIAIIDRHVLAEDRQREGTALTEARRGSNVLSCRAVILKSTPTIQLLLERVQPALVIDPIDVIKRFHLVHYLAPQENLVLHTPCVAHTQ